MIEKESISSFESWIWQSPRQGLPMKHWDDTVFLDVLAPTNGRWYDPRNPTEAVISFRTTLGENDVTSSLFLGVLVVQLHLWGSISLKLQSQEEESSSGSYCVVWPWARSKTLDTYQVAQLSCEVIEQSNTSRDHGIMTSGGVKWKCGDASILTHPWRHSLWWEQVRLQRRLDQDLGEVGESR